MFLRHNVVNASKIYKNDKTIIRTILEDGFLRNANTTKNSQMTGRITDEDYDKTRGQTIYFEINLDVKQWQTLTLDINLLLEQPFWLDQQRFKMGRP
jgi:hypothetical protein